MLGVCYRYASSKEEAEDMMQEGFIKVFDNLKRFRMESSLQTWITRIMINTALNHLKVAKRLRLESLDQLTEQDMPMPSEVQLHQYDSRVVMDCIQQLPDGYRVVLNLYAIEGFSHKEIASQLGINESTSRSQFARAKNLLMKKLEQVGTLNERRYAGE